MNHASRQTDAGPDLSVLLIDDDVELCELMREFFARGPSGSTRSTTAVVVWPKRSEAAYDLILLDVMLPGLDGFELLRQVRRRSHVPIIMLTARTTKDDRVAGLDAGADDYLPKPFDPDELTARIRAVPARGSIHGPRARGAGDQWCQAISGSREAWSDGRPLELTTIEFDILDLIARSAGRVVSRHELSAAIHQRPASPLDRSLDVHVSHLRKKLGRSGGLISNSPRGRLPVPGRVARADWDGSMKIRVRSIFPKVVLWFVATVALSMVGLLATSALLSCAFLRP